jgi:hypothetical protein
VNAENASVLATIDAPEIVFEAMDSGEEPFLTDLISSCPAPARLVLKVGAWVSMERVLMFSSAFVCVHFASENSVLLFIICLFYFFAGTIFH